MDNPQVALRSSDIDRTSTSRQYSEAKQSASGYQRAKSSFYQSFKKTQLGNWVKKPMEQDEFEL